MSLKLISSGWFYGIKKEIKSVIEMEREYKENVFCQFVRIWLYFMMGMGGFVFGKIQRHRVARFNPESERIAMLRMNAKCFFIDETSLP